MKSLNEAKGAVSVSNDQGIELRALEREAAAQRELLESFLARYREASARTDANYLPADARIISRAVAPSEPSFPKKTMMAIAAAIATLLLASAIVLLAEFTSGRAFRVIGYGAARDARPPVRPAPLLSRLTGSSPSRRPSLSQSMRPRSRSVPLRRTKSRSCRPGVSHCGSSLRRRTRSRLPPPTWRLPRNCSTRCRKYRPPGTNWRSLRGMPNPS